MKRVYFIFALLLIVTFSQAQVIVNKELSLMGTDFTITVVAPTSEIGQLYISDAVTEIRRIEALISSWQETSETTFINNNAGIQPVKVSVELFNLIKRSIAISKLTDGAFDISYASMDRIWKFDGSMKQMPRDEVIKISVANVGYNGIELNEIDQTVFLKREGMKIGFGAIGKGYAADAAKALLIQKGVAAGIINASGDMNTWGTQPNGSPWRVAITNPLDNNKAFALLPITDAVVTSGNYEKFVMFNDIRYAHIIDPRTGYPSQGILSVTVFAPKAELADALATSVFVMGIEPGIDRMNQFPGVECIAISTDGAIFTTKNITLDLKK
ncbi:MAG: thiamine biosynthesis lipoprotein [Saprospiraceae bacterium]|jgi:thiamine biosynthesis lipoprotein|uniref:FAD:protein FMN transferase n=1 Tax=Patiriisocius sp. Uisw_047 TaxID=3230969 RepID=UPI0039EA1F9C